MATITQDGDTFIFKTQDMRGRIAPEGAYHGIWELRDSTTGRDLIHPKYSALNLFRLFAVHQGMGQPRTMPRTVTCNGDSVTIHWAATDAHLGEIEARYTVSSPASIDLEIAVRIRGTYAGYEIFLSNYFDPGLRPFVYLKGNRYGKTSSGQDRVCPMANDVFRGTVLVFARDAHASRRCIDGRWDRSEWGAPTVQMCPVRHYAVPVAYLEDPDHARAVVLMSRPEHCASISTRYHADNEADRMTPYSAFDFSLFGRDVVPGVEIRAHMRLALVSLSETVDMPLNAYETFQKESRA